MVLLQPVSQEEARNSPMFINPNKNRAFTHTELNSVLKAILRQIKKQTQFKDMELDHYTWHSFRIFLCTALINNDESHATVQAMCRWQTPQSIHDYGTMDATRYYNILLGAMNKNLTTEGCIPGSGDRAGHRRTRRRPRRSHTLQP